MALPRLTLIESPAADADCSDSLSENEFALRCSDSFRENEFALREDDRGTVRQSTRMRIQTATFYPERMRTITMDVVAAVYEDAYGYRFDFDRVVASFMYTRLDFPRRLMGPLLIELSKHLHPGRRREFLKTACDTLHQLESTPRVFV